VDRAFRGFAVHSVAERANDCSYHMNDSLCPARILNSCASYAQDLNRIIGFECGGQNHTRSSEPEWARIQEDFENGALSKRQVPAGPACPVVRSPRKGMRCKFARIRRDGS